MMPGVSYDEIVNAILGAFDAAELKFVLRVGMDVRLDVVANTQGRFEATVTDLLDWVERRGREAELVRVTARARPAQAEMQRIFRKYGLAIPVASRSHGELVVNGPSDETDGQLEAFVRPALGMFDYTKWKEQLAKVDGWVCRISIGGHGAGTGFLIGPQVVLTNYHVVKAILDGGTDASEVRCEFDYRQLPTGARSCRSLSLHSTEWRVDWSPPTADEEAGNADGALPSEDHLDYAVLKLAEPVGERPAFQNPGAGAPARGWFRVPRARPTFKSPMGLLIPQHPDGQTLKLGIDTDAIDQAAGRWLNANGTRVRYATNTEPGASGSPCLDLQWNLMALHHFGDGGQGERVGFNQGIPIAAIVRRLERNVAAMRTLGI